MCDLGIKFTVFIFTFPYGVSGQVWNFIASIPELCLLYLNEFDWYQMFALDSIVVKTQNVLNPRGGLLTFAMIIIQKQYYQFNTLFMYNGFPFTFLEVSIGGTADCNCGSC